MKEFIDKLIERLEKEKIIAFKTYRTFDMNTDLGRMFGIEKSIEIINELKEEYKSKTQADKIRSTSDAELAELFAQYSCEDADYTSLLPIKDCKWGTKQEVIDRNLKWLQSEA